MALKPSFLLITYFMLCYFIHIKYSVYCVYVGCYDENVSNRTSYVNIYFNTTMTIKWCQEKCQQKGCSYAGLKSFRCYCGNSYNRYSKTDQSNCNVTCSGNNLEYCGGEKAISIYTVCSPGFYGIREPGCSLKCPDNCGSYNEKVDKICELITGDCTESCKPGWSGEKCLMYDECDYTSGRNISQNVDNQPNSAAKFQNISSSHVLLFPTLVFTKKGMLSKITYFAESNGTIFVSIWNILKQNSQTLQNVTAEYCGKVKIDVIPGLHTYIVPHKQGISTDKDYCLGLHYSKTSSTNGAIPIFFHANNQNMVLKPVVLSAEYTDKWWKVGSSQNFSINNDVQSYKPLSIHIGLKVFAKCDTSCPKNSYGENCDKKCGHCGDNIQCHITTGECPTNCVNGWTGDLCNMMMKQTNSSVGPSTIWVNSSSTKFGMFSTTIEQSTSDVSKNRRHGPVPVDNSIKLTIGLASGVVVTLILLLIAIIGFTRCEMKKRNRFQANSLANPMHLKVNHTKKKKHFSKSKSKRYASKSNA